MSNNRWRVSILFAARILLAATLAGCAASPAVVASGAPTPDRLDGVYVGGPMGCMQASSVALSVVSEQANTVRAIFNFGIGSGTDRYFGFTLHGVYDAQRRSIVLQAGEWLQSYDSYRLVPIEMRFDPGGGAGKGELRGTIHYAGCREVTLRRDPSVPMPVALQGGHIATALLAATDRHLPSIRSVKGDAQCELLIRWVGRAVEEKRIGPLVSGYVPLLRDEEFLPLFGQSYEAATPKWRSDLYADVVKNCMSNSHLSTVDLGDGPKTIAQQLGTFKEFLAGALVQSVGDVNPDYIRTTLGQGAESRGWIGSTLVTADTTSPTLSAINRLRRLVPPAEPYDAAVFFRNNHRGLWPSEEHAFAKALRGKVAAVEGRVADAWLADLERADRNLAAVARVNEQIQTYADFIGELEPAQRERTMTAAYAQFNQIVDGAMASWLDALRKAPATTKGAVETAPIARALADQVAHLYLSKPIDYRDAPEASLIRARFIDVQRVTRGRIVRAMTAERARIIRGAQPEWQAQLASAASWNELQGPASVMRRMFTEDSSERVFRTTFETALLTRSGVDLSGIADPTQRQLFANLFLGQFEQATDNSLLDGPSGRRFALEAYVVKFSERCSKFLPPDPVQIIRIETEDLVTKQGGFEISRIELRREEIKTGIFAAPAFASAYTSPRPADLAQALSILLRNLMDVPRTMRRVIETSLEMRVDVGQFLDRHGCDSPITKRLAENILRAAEGRPPVVPVL